MTRQQILQQAEEKFDKEFGYEEIFVCGNCDHIELNHYWNGGGNPDYAGYDSCTVDGCKCEYKSDELVIKKVPKNQSISLFLQSTLSEAIEETLKAVEIEPIETSERITIEYVNITGRDESMRAYVREASTKVLQNQAQKVKEFNE